MHTIHIYAHIHIYVHIHIYQMYYLLVFCTLTTTNVTSGRIPTCSSAPWWRLYCATLWGDQDTGNSQSYNPKTAHSSPYPHRFNPVVYIYIYNKRKCIYILYIFWSESIFTVKSIYRHVDTSVCTYVDIFSMHVHWALHIHTIHFQIYIDMCMYIYIYMYLCLDISLHAQPVSTHIWRAPFQNVINAIIKNGFPMSTPSSEIMF